MMCGVVVAGQRAVLGETLAGCRESWRVAEAATSVPVQRRARLCRTEEISQVHARLSPRNAFD